MLFFPFFSCSTPDFVGNSLVIVICLFVLQFYGLSFFFWVLGLDKSRAVMCIFWNSQIHILFFIRFLLLLFLGCGYMGFSLTYEKSDISHIHGILFISCIFHTLLSWINEVYLEYDSYSFDNFLFYFDNQRYPFGGGGALYWHLTWRTVQPDVT